MKNIIIITLILLPQFIFSQKYFTHNDLIKITDNRRWESNIKIFIYGDCDSVSKNTINKTIKHFNSLMETIQISLVNDKEESNTIIYFLTDEEYQNLFPYCDHSDNIGVTYNKISLTNKNEYIGAEIQIDNYVNKKYSSFEYVIKHEMFHMLGFDHHKNESNSIIKYSHNYTKKDDEMIKYLYSKEFKF